MSQPLCLSPLDHFINPWLPCQAFSSLCVVWHSLFRNVLSSLAYLILAVWWHFFPSEYSFTYIDSKTLCVCVCVCVQSCPTLCDFMDCSLPGSSVHGIFLARILEWVAISYSRGSSWPRDQNLHCSASPALAGEFFTTAPPGTTLKPHKEPKSLLKISRFLKKWFYLLLPQVAFGNAWRHFYCHNYVAATDI